MYDVLARSCWSHASDIRTLWPVDGQSLTPVLLLELHVCVQKIPLPLAIVGCKVTRKHIFTKHLVALIYGPNQTSWHSVNFWEYFQKSSFTKITRCSQESTLYNQINLLEKSFCDILAVLLIYLHFSPGSLEKFVCGDMCKPHHQNLEYFWPPVPF